MTTTSLNQVTRSLESQTERYRLHALCARLDAERDILVDLDKWIANHSPAVEYFLQHIIVGCSQNQPLVTIHHIKTNLGERRAVHERNRAQYKADYSAFQAEQEKVNAEGLLKQLEHEYAEYHSTQAALVKLLNAGKAQAQQDSGVSFLDANQAYDKQSKDLKDTQHKINERINHLLTQYKHLQASISSSLPDLAEDKWNDPNAFQTAFRTIWAQLAHKRAAPAPAASDTTTKTTVARDEATCEHKRPVEHNHVDTRRLSSSSSSSLETVSVSSLSNPSHVGDLVKQAQSAKDMCNTFESQVNAYLVSKKNLGIRETDLTRREALVASMRANLEQMSSRLTSNSLEFARRMVEKTRNGMSAAEESLIEARAETLRAKKQLAESKQTLDATIQAYAALGLDDASKYGLPTEYDTMTKEKLDFRMANLQDNLRFLVIERRTAHHHHNQHQ